MPAIQVAIERTNGASISTCLKLFIQAFPILLSFLPTLAQTRTHPGCEADASGRRPGWLEERRRLKRWRNLMHGHD